MSQHSLTLIRNGASPAWARPSAVSNTSAPAGPSLVRRLATLQLPSWHRLPPVTPSTDPRLLPTWRGKSLSHLPPACRGRAGEGASAHPQLSSTPWAQALVASVLLLLTLPAHATAEPVFHGVSKTSNQAEKLMETGRRHEYGVGATQDMDLAIKSYCDAAAQGHAEARYHLGWIYSTGRAGKVDEILAAAWFKSAADSNHKRAKTQIKTLGAEDLDLGQEAACVLTGAMVARKIPTERPAQKEAPPTQVAKNDFEVRDLNGNDIKGLVKRLAPDYNLDPELVLALVSVESNFNPKARSPKNAQGLMQLIPATAERFGVRNVWDPLDNLRGGMAYLRWLLDHFEGDVELALAGYNAGEGAVHDYGGIPPYPETQGYVKRITKKLGYRRTSERPPTLRSMQTSGPAVPDATQGSGATLRFAKSIDDRS